MKTNGRAIVKIDLVRSGQFLLCSTIVAGDPIMGDLGLSSRRVGKRGGVFSLQ